MKPAINRPDEGGAQVEVSLLETVNCHYCHSADAAELFVGEDYWYGSPGRFPVRRCRSCGLIYLSPRPTLVEIGRYYPEAYSPHQIKEEAGGWWPRLKYRYSRTKQVRFVRRFAPRPGRVLDVGCATGVFLAEMRRQGWQVAGVEPDQAAADYARSQLKIEVFPGELAAAGLAEDSFDLITFWHVMEHVYDPRATLRECRRIARPGGKLLLTIPNPESWEAAWFGRYWAGWDIPRHLHIFSAGLIGDLLRETGWRPLKMTGNSGRIWLLRLSFQHWLTHQDDLSPRLVRLIRGLVSSPLMWVVTFPYFIVAEKLNRSSIMAVIAEVEK